MVKLSDVDVTPSTVTPAGRVVLEKFVRALLMFEPTISSGVDGPIKFDALRHKQYHAAKDQLLRCPEFEVLSVYYRSLVSYLKQERTSRDEVMSLVSEVQMLEYDLIKLLDEIKAQQRARQTADTAAKH